jgi:hypothetical protein
VSGRRWWLVGLAIAAAVVVVLAPLASADPDGLERVATDQGFADRAEDPPFAVIADYVFPGLDGPAATIVAGLIGVVVVFAVIWLVGRLLVRRSPGPDR